MSSVKSNFGFKPAYGYYQQPHKKRQGVSARGFADFCVAGLTNLLKKQDLWSLYANHIYGIVRPLMLLFLAVMLGYALNLSMNAPQAPWARAWMWPAAEFFGLTVKTVEIQGHRQDSEIALKAAAQVETGTPIFSIDVASIQDKIGKLAGVKFASVQTLLPNTVRISVEEREPFALWQRNGQWAIIDEDGAIITETPDDRYKDLPYIVGTGAPKNAPALLAHLERYPDLMKKMKHAIYVSERRWNLGFENGVEVKLPEQNAAQAIADLARLDKEGNLFNKDITIVDLRFPNKVILRLSDAAADQRKEQIKQKFGKKTNGKPT